VTETYNSLGTLNSILLISSTITTPSYLPLKGFTIYAETINTVQLLMMVTGNHYNSSYLIMFRK
jgi:hypothetical protein